MAARSEGLADRPDFCVPGKRSVRMDVLSDVLAVVRLSAAIFVDVDVTAPWSAQSPPTRDLKRALPGARHLMSYHLVTAGEAWATPENAEPIHLPAGTMIVFPHGSGHAVGSNPSLGPGERIVTPHLPVALSRPYVIRGGGAGSERAKLVCGFFGCDAQPFNPLLDCLPETILLSAHDSGSGDLGVFFQLAAAEANAGHPGSAATLNRLGELMLIEALRRYMREDRAHAPGWIGGMRDPQIGRALAAIHKDPLHPWTIERIAREAGMSRTRFASAFHDLVGLTPMDYVTNWRLQLGAHCLASGASIAAAAAQSGYESSSSFSRAFQRKTGHAPGAWRREVLG
jgi:AraC-like DNA-binding protein